MHVFAQTIWSKWNCSREACYTYAEIQQESRSTCGDIDNVVGEQEPMALINMAKREIQCKIVYYGMGLCGKTTNLHVIHQAVRPQDVGTMVSIDTETERTLYFDLLPLELGKVNGFQIRFQLYTVPGQILYQQTRISVLKGADCVIFVADSQASKLQENIESWNELQEQVRRMKKDVSTFPFVMQWNKRDLQDILPTSVLEKYLNPYHAPSVDAVAVIGQGVIESLRLGINATLRNLPRF
jgi:GTPase SAR1 family protein